MHFLMPSRRRFLTTGVLLSASGLMVFRDADAQSDASSASTAKTTAYSKNINVVLAFCRAGQNRDLEAQMRFITDDSVYHNMPDQPCVGRAQIRTMLGAFITRADAIEIIIRNVAISPTGVVLTERLDRSRIKGKWIDAPVMGATEIANGKVKRWRDYYDNQRLRAQMT